MWIAWRPWSDERGPARLARKRLDGLDDRDRQAFEAHKTPHDLKGFARKRADGAIGVELWVDAPPSVPRSDIDVRDGLARAVAELGSLARTRRPDLDDTLDRALSSWATRVVDAKATAASCPGSAWVASLGRGAVAAGFDTWQSAPDGTWKDLGATLMVSVGPDRYGIRLRRQATASPTGEVPFPNEPFRVRVWTAVDAISASFTRLADDVTALEADVGAALTTASGRDVRGLLHRTQTSLNRRGAIERRRAELAATLAQLRTGGRRDAYEVDDVVMDVLERIERRLTDARTQLVDTSQLLLAAGSWQQAGRTETLSLVAAALLPPTIVAGVFGANVLPWDATSEPDALIGMAALMLASAILAVAIVALWGVIRAATATRLRVTACALGLVAATTLGAGGGVLVAGGTTPAQPPQQAADDALSDATEPRRQREG